MSQTLLQIFSLSRDKRQDIYEQVTPASSHILVGITPVVDYISRVGHG